MRRLRTVTLPDPQAFCERKLRFFMTENFLRYLFAFK